MKKLFLAALPILLLLGCEYDDSDIWNEFGKLNDKVEQNSNDIATLSALVEALNKGKVIVSAEQTATGVVLTFSDGSSVTINNGADGKNGTDGKDGINGADGKDGKDGKDGDSFFVSVEEDETTVTITLADGRVIVLPKATADDEEQEQQYELRVLTFEDADAKFEPYMLDYYANSIDSWSSLIDPLQYGGDLLYNMSGGTYTWADSGNTNLTHSCAVPYWTGGHAVSNYIVADYSTLPEGYYGWYELQLATLTGGHNGSANFCVHNGYRDDFNAEIYDAQLQGFAFADGIERVIDHMFVTNTCYVLNSLLYGNGFAPPATEESLFKVVAYGYDTADNLTASTEIVLCKGTTPVTEWVKFDLSPLGKVAKVVFNFAPSSDLVGSYGMNTPAYFAYDDVAVRFE